nr:RNA-directed DNA polymerase [Ipomoea batatas]
MVRVSGKSSNNVASLLGYGMPLPRRAPCLEIGAPWTTPTATSPPARLKLLLPRDGLHPAGPVQPAASKPGSELHAHEETWPQEEVASSFQITLCDEVPTEGEDEEKVTQELDEGDLNVACPKDDFSLCIIESMTDVVTRHKIMSFMDDFSNYNQIRMASEDEELIAF